MRLALLLTLCTLSCAADPVLLPDAGPCSSACGAGTVCQAGACVAVDAGAEDRPAPVDLGTPDAGTPMDVQRVDAAEDRPGADVPSDVDPRQSEVCRGVNATCDGRRVNVQGGERDGGVVTHCGGCGITCAVGEVCDLCVCAR